MADIVKREKLQSVREMIKKYEGNIQALLPDHVKPDRVARIAYLAITKSPELLNCRKETLIGGILKSAQLGLEPDGVQAALVAYKTECVFQPMFQGLLDLAYRSPKIKSVSAYVVRENDVFDYTLGTNPAIEHKPSQEGGTLTHAYCVIELTTGGQLLEVCDKAYIDKVRGASKAAKSQYSPWTQWEDLMWRKTALRSALKYAPKSYELREAIALDTAADLREPQRLDALILDDDGDLVEDRGDVDRTAQKLEERLGITDEPAGEPWICSKCQQSNTVYVTTCSGCGQSQ